MADIKNIKFLLACLAFAFTAWLPGTANAVVEGAIEHEKGSSSFDHLGTGFALVGSHGELDCKACHTEGIFEDLATQCADCHNGSTALGTSPNHAPVTQSCDACHNQESFELSNSSTMDHTVLDQLVCSSCHDGVTATGKNATHLQTNLECDACHNVNIWTTTGFDHSFAGNQACVSCHNGTDATGKTVTHISTTDLCASCHTTDGWRPVTTVDHGQVAGACSSCHDGTIATGKGVNHIPTTEQCNACHTVESWVATFDHSTLSSGQACIDCHNGAQATGKADTHINASEQCDACHTTTDWLVAPSAVDHSQVIGVCSSCHDGTIATGKHDTHIGTTAECDTCHAVGAWLPAAVDHTGFVNNCIDCHNGTEASGKGNNHINTSDICDSCHQAFPATWIPVSPASVDHTQVVGTCIDCHNATIASGKGTNHIASSDNCDSCHATGPAPWQPVAPADVNHNEVIGVCSDCHDGTIASGKSTSHINSSDNCAACHAPGPTPWQPVAPADVDHNEVIGLCSDCHNGTIATGKSDTHIQTNAECDTCHTVGAWTPATVDHTNYAPGSCIDCHDGTTASGKTTGHIDSSTLCDACHERFPANWQPVAPASVDHTQVNGTCISCHDGTTASGKGPSHINSSDNCAACHATGPTPWQPVAPASVDHNEVIGVCSSCHDGTIATGQDADHISTTDECDTCHTVGAWLPVAVDHTGFANNCIDCHNGTNASGKSNTHINSSDQCDSCHAVFPATWAPVQPTAVDHAQVIGTCISCHDGTTASGKSTSHITSSDNCDACHAVGPTPWQPVAVADVNHNEVTGTCISCHDGTIASGKSTSHIVTSDNCDACHATGPTPWQPVAAADVNHNEVTGTCISCHDGTIASGKSTTHIASSDNCVACHATGPTPWQPVAPANVDHNEVIGVCSSCHDGTIAMGKNVGHINTTEECDTCHTVGAWLPAAVDHTGFVNNCIDCHNGTDASGKNNTHINTTDLCDACHSPFPATWAPVAPASVDHTQVIGTCISCHNGTTASGKGTTHIASSDNCEACHATGPTPWAPVAPANVDHNEIMGSCVSCHDGAIASGKSNTHINTTDLCEACHAVAPTPWQPVAPTDVDHNQVLGTCASCHDGTTAVGKGNNHLNTSDNCDACHAPGPTPWAPVAPANVNHNEVVGTCISCHDGTTAIGKSNTHINTSDNCEACHAAAPTPWQPVAPSNVDHNEVIGVCSSCHDGTIATGKDTGHLNTTEECDSCHTVGAWLPATVDHTGFVNNCIDCHNNTNASGKPNTHINSTDLCDACHSPFPATWVPLAPADVDHSQVIGTCISCHNGTIATGKGVTHISSSDNCEACHFPGPTPWVPVAPANVDHNEILGSCISCHDGVIASGKSNTHINTTDVCDACHAVAPTPWSPVATADVDHNQVLGTCASCHDGTIAIGKGNTHINTTNNCEACHAAAPVPWQPVVPSNVDHNEVIGVCSSCHDGTIAIGKDADHIQTTQECDVCHTVGAWLPAGVDHSGFVNNCIDCHNNTDATGKSNNHINTTDLCDACHAVFPATWAPVASNAVDHGQVIGTCVSCHDGNIAIGKSTTHINTTNVCDACHTPGPTPWTPVAASAVDHNEVIGTCVSCHDGTTAIGKGPTHINSTDVCEACHAPAPTPWAPAVSVDHNEVLGSCSTCHDGVISTGKDLGHVQTTEECGTCHLTTAWLPATVDHTNFVTNCIRCHDGVSATGKTAAHLNTSDVCEACHQKHPANWTPVASTDVDHNEVIGTCVSCHNGTDAIGKSNTHIASSDNCDACHTPGPTPWSPVAPNAVDHNEVIGSCASCHDGNIAIGKPNTHINTTDVCEACHAPAPTPWAPVASANVDHDQVIGTCASCHNNVTAIGKGTNHINSSDVCEACHLPAPTPWAPLAPSSVDHNEVIGTCESCHDGVIAIGKSGTHPNTTHNCAACHAPSPTPWISVTTVDHNEVLGNCASCHDGVIATGKPNDHIVTAAECDACHTTLGWLPAGVDHSTFVNNCIDCHNGSTATGKTNAHINSTDLCDACHEVFPATWVPVASSSVDHTQVLGTCASCHDGVIATGQSNQHIATSNNCAACHQPGPTPWIPVSAQNVDHNEVIGTCVSCHDNSTAPGKPGDHPTTTDNCDACHVPGPSPWSSFNVDHNEVTGCQSCHDGGVARGKNNGHCPTNQDCDFCHRTTSWGNTIRDC